MSLCGSRVEMVPGTQEASTDVISYSESWYRLEVIQMNFTNNYLGVFHFFQFENSKGLPWSHQIKLENLSM